MEGRRAVSLQELKRREMTGELGVAVERADLDQSDLILDWEVVFNRFHIPAAIR